MRRLLLLALVPSVVFAAPARKPVVAVLPVKASTPELARLGLLMEARAAMLLVTAGQHSTLDMKQVLAMAGQEGLDPAQLSEDANADKALVLLGADRVVAVTLSGDASGLTVQGSVRDGKAPVAFSAKVPGAWAAALTQGSEAMAKALLEKDGGTLAAGTAAQPESKSDAALKSLGACWETALKQPLGIDAPVGLSGKELDDAVAACRAALKADGSLRFASATLALLLAVGREDAEAEKLLGAPADTDAALMPWALARFWLATRNQSNEAAVKFIGGVLAKHPGVLVLRSFQANTLAAMNEHAKAVAAWNEYLALAPSSAFAQGRLSRSLARQDKHAEALAAAKKGLTLAPDSREARLVVAARQLDAGKLNDAKATLQPLVSLPNAPAEPMLHLGLAYLAANDVKSAAPLFQSAAERASGPRGWRTKGRALYGLAVCEAKQKHLDLAKAAYAKSLETGYAVASPDPALAEVVKGAGAAAEAPASAGALYINVEPGTAPSPDSGALAEKVLREKLGGIGASFAPPGEDKKVALSVIKSKHLKGYQLRMQLQPGETGSGLKVEMLVMSYPEQALKGTWSVKAAGGKPEKVIPMMVNRVVDDAAGDLDWKN
jgi:Tfp pilus assembly protein PilF